MSDADKFFERSKPLETSEIFLTNSTDEIDLEIEQNTVQLSVTMNTAKQLSAIDLVAFLNRIKSNRLTQLRESGFDINLIYYLWFDELAGQLRFNFLNSNHVKLPFAGEIVFVNNEQEIINDFLNSNHLEGIPWNELEFSESANEKTAHPQITDDFKIKVYKQLLTR